MKTIPFRKTISTPCCIFLTVALLFTSACSDLPPTTEQYTVQRETVSGLPTVVATNTLNASATVDAIDYSNRSIALTGPNGNTEIFHVKPDVVNFNQIKKGDIVNLEYNNRLAVSVRKASQPLSVTQLSTVDLAPLGAQPGIFATRSVVMDANVQSINYDTRVVVLQPLTGKPITFTVDPRLKDLDKVHVGDQVIFNYTEAVTIYVAPKP